MLERKTENSTSFIFYVNDGSTAGPIECKLWKVGTNDKSYALSNAREGTLVRVMGNLREYEGRMYLFVYDDVHQVGPRRCDRSPVGVEGGSAKCGWWL